MTPSLHSHGSRGSDVGGTSWLVDGKWSVTKLLDMSNAMRAALADGRKLMLGELEELNCVLEMMVCPTAPWQATALFAAAFLNLIKWLIHQATN